MPLELTEKVPGAIWMISEKSEVGEVKFWMKAEEISVRAERASSKPSMGARAAAMEPEAVASTVTCSLAAPTARGRVRSWSAAVRATSLPVVPKDLAEASTVYLPGARAGEVKWPCGVGGGLADLVGALAADDDWRRWGMALPCCVEDSAGNVRQDRRLGVCGDGERKAGSGRDAKVKTIGH